LGDGARRPSTASDRPSIADLAQQLGRPQSCVVGGRTPKRNKGFGDSTGDGTVAYLMALKLVYDYVQKWRAVGLTQPPDCGTDLKIRSFTYWDCERQGCAS
jgi:hypothetical protein